MKQNGILAVDIGTSSIRVSMFTKEDGIKDMWKVSHSLDARFSADLLWEKVKQLMEQGVKTYPGTEVISMAVSSFLGWVVVDKRGKPTELAWSWMAHAEKADTEAILDKLPKHVAAKIGRKPSEDLAAFLWKNTLKKYDGATVLSFKDYCIYKLTGNLIMDRTHASYTGLLSISQRNWDEEMVEYFGLSPSLLPELGDGEKSAGGITENMAEELGVTTQTPVILSGPDGTMAVLGSGGVSPGNTVEVMGTTDVFFHVNRCVDNDELYEQGLVQNCFFESDLYAIGGPMGMTGGTINWFMQQWSLDYDDEECTEMWKDWSKIKAAEDGLYIIPSFTGARVPDWNPAVKGTVVGLKPEHTRKELYKASVEGIALLTARLRRKIAGFIDIGKEMMAIGGGAQNNILLQTRASASGCIINIPKEIEASTIGAVLLAGKAAGFYSSYESGIQELNPIKQKINPEINLGQKYEKHLEEYSMLLSHMDGWYTNDR